MSQGKMARYRQAKQREKAQRLAAETGKSYELALSEVAERERTAAKTLSKMGKGARKQRKQGPEKPAGPDTPFERFCRKVRNGYVPYQGGAPGLGKDS